MRKGSECNGEGEKDEQRAGFCEQRMLGDKICDLRLIDHEGKLK